ncbi:Uncharacterised protein [Klebsiella pneumoniae]|nr:Uncharacterised protein [Klebsiella pneumoniae]
MTWPSSASTVLLIERLLVTRSTAFAARVAVGAMEDISCSISRRSMRSSPMCGVTLRVTPISLRSTVVNGLLEPLALVV